MSLIHTGDLESGCTNVDAALSLHSSCLRLMVVGCSEHTVYSHVAVI